MEGDAAYFARRARQQREAALKAAHPAARSAHIELANRYEELSQAIGSHDPQGSRVEVLVG